MRPEIGEDGNILMALESRVEMEPMDVQRVLRVMLADPRYERMIERMGSENDTAVGRGICPFPLRCRGYEDCDLEECNADRLENGLPCRN